MKPTITMMIRLDGMEKESFRKTFDLVNGGLNLIDANGDLWHLIDRDEIHMVYAKSSKNFEDTSDWNSEDDN